MQLDAIRFRQHGKEMFSTRFRADQLLDEARIHADVYDSVNNPSGYQRPLTEGRARLFASYVSTMTNVSPPSVLLAVRDDMVFTPHQANSDIGSLQILDTSTLYIVDGQHRIEGLRHIFRTGGTIDFEIPTVLINHKLLGELDPAFCEAKEFVVINQTQKKVRADLHDRFVARLTPQQRKELDSAIPSETAETTARSVAICDTLNTRAGSPWFGVVQLPGAGRAQGYVKQRSFTESIQKTILTQPVITQSLDDTAITDAIDAWWTAWSKVCPEAFDSNTRGDYVLQKQYVSLKVVNNLLGITLIFFIASKRQISMTSFREVIERMNDGNTSDYWKKGGFASQFRGEGGAKDLYNKLLPLLTQVLSSP